MCRTKFFGQRQAVVVDINRNDVKAAGDFCRHDSTQSNGTTAVYGDGRTELRLEPVQYCASASLNATAEWAEERQIDSWINFDDIAFMSNRKSSKRRLAEKRRHGVVVVMDPICAVLHFAEGGRGGRTRAGGSGLGRVGGGLGSGRALLGGSRLVAASNSQQTGGPSQADEQSGTVIFFHGE